MTRAEKAELLKWIVRDLGDDFPGIDATTGVMGGAPCIRGLRIPVAVLVELVADGLSIDAIVELYPDLEREDIPAALRFAAEVVRRDGRPLS